MKRKQVLKDSKEIIETRREMAVCLNDIVLRLIVTPTRIELSPLIADYFKFENTNSKETIKKWREVIKAMEYALDSIPNRT